MDYQTQASDLSMSLMDSPQNAIILEILKG